MIKRSSVFKVVVFTVFGLFILPAPVIADEPLATTHTLEGLVAKWVDLRRELAEGKENWEEQKERLEQEYTLLLKEKKMLGEEIAQAKQEQTQAEAEQAELVKSREVSKEAIKECLPALSRAEANLKKWQIVLPSPLLSPLKKSFDQLPKAEGKSVSQRLQVVLTLYGEIERLQHNVHVYKESLNIGSGRVQEMDVIYLGLAKGFAVSKDNKIAGVGSPSLPDGWKWHWCPEIAFQVRKGIDFYQHKKIAGFAHLPVKIEEIRGE